MKFFKLALLMLLLLTIYFQGVKAGSEKKNGDDDEDYEDGEEDYEDDEEDDYDEDEDGLMDTLDEGLNPYSGHIFGFVQLDSITFYKIVPSMNALILFYSPSYEAQNEKEATDLVESMVTVGRKLRDHQSVLLAKVDSSDYPDLMVSQGQNMESEAPLIVYLPKGANLSEAEQYIGAITADGLIDFVQHRAGLPGYFQQVDPALEMFFRGDKVRKQKALVDLQVLTRDCCSYTWLERKMLQQYVSILSKVMTQGLDVVPQELAKIQSLMEAMGKNLDVQNYNNLEIQVKILQLIQDIQQQLNKESMEQ